MGKAITLKIITLDGEIKIKMREKLTINNLKLILANKMMISREEIKLMIDDNEASDHMRLTDQGLKDGSILEAKVAKEGCQVEEVKNNKEDRSGKEQHYNYSERPMWDD